MSSNVLCSDKFPKGCTILTPVSFNVESDEGGIKMDKGTSLENRYSEVGQ